MGAPQLQQRMVACVPGMSCCEPPELRSASAIMVAASAPARASSIDPILADGAAPNGLPPR